MDVMRVKFSWKGIDANASEDFWLIKLKLKKSAKKMRKDGAVLMEMNIDPT